MITLKSTKRLMAFFAFLSGITSGLFSCSQPVSKPADAAMKTSIYEIKVKTITGEETTLASFKGKKMLIVNVASECGYTPQYAGLQKLHEMYGDKVAVLGFPSNDFGGQEPGSEEQIQSFCSKNYGVTFPMFSKIKVKGNDMHPLYQWLTNPEKNGWNSQAPVWNFNKYLIDENGNLTDYFPSKVNPLDDLIISKIK
jgi:glutathione peroxidase